MKKQISKGYSNDTIADSNASFVSFESAQKTEVDKTSVQLLGIDFDQIPIHNTTSLLHTREMSFQCSIYIE